MSAKHALPSTSLHKQKICAGGLVFYKKDLLIVQSRFSRKWLLPGEAIEGEESPAEGLLRSLNEHLNLNAEVGPLLLVDYIHNRDLRGEYLYLLFSVKSLREDQAQQIRINKEVFRDFKILHPERALELLTPEVSRRLKYTLKNFPLQRQLAYLENGMEPFFKTDIAL